MFSRCLQALVSRATTETAGLVILAVAAGSRAYAFDPFTAAAVIGTGASAVGAVSESAGEVAASADAFSELYGEIDSGAEVGDDGQRLIQEIQEIESLAYEAGYTKEEIEQLTADSANKNNARKLSSTLKSITRAVRAGKRVARLFMKLDQKAKISEVESAQIEREQLVALYKQLRADHERDLREIKERLRDQKDKRDQIATLKKEEKKSGAMAFGRTGVLSFPKQDAVIEEAIRMATGLRPVLLQLLLFVFLIRAVFYQFGFFGMPRYGDLIRDTILCVVLLMVFPELVRACILMCNGVAASIGLKELREVEPGKLDFPAEIGLSFKARLLLEWLFQWIKYFAFVTAQFLANFGLAFLVLLFPIVIFCSQMLNFSVAWPIFLGSFLCICLWPLFWNATGMLAAMLWRKQDASLSEQLATILFSILQFLSPLIGIASMKGQPLSKSIQSAGSAVMGALSGGASTVLREATGLVKGAVGSRGGGGLGRALSYPINQSAGRVMAAGSRGLGAVRATPNPAWGTALKAAAAGFVTNEARPPAAGGGAGRAVIRVAQGFKSQPLLPKAEKLDGAKGKSNPSHGRNNGGKHVPKT